MEMSWRREEVLFLFLLIKNKKPILLLIPTRRILMTLDDAVDLVFLRLITGSAGDLFVHKAPVQL